MTEVSARRAVTRDKICDAAIHVFAEQGVRGASVEEICELAGFTRGAFYSNFETKDDLCAAIIERHLARMLAALDEVRDRLVPAGDLTLSQIIDLGIATFIATQPSDRALILTLESLRLHAAREPRFQPVYRAMDRAATTQVADIIEQVLARHQCELTTSAVEAVGMLHAVYDHGAISALIRSEHPTDASRIALLDLVLRSLIRRKDDASASQLAHPPVK